ncbi:adenylyl-sulfate kinase [Paracraurococcus ruber]|uniref:APS kinase domain-containing protein n=1 Tax=Paracraurococcus ruber TaxID=77675 RepID=A0ABS1CVS0_9PROT|nr:adenylyl-sulfate kinase [Paracraurococcus ruber]MBK1658602.1 hypothetical protein [Paracraurococcus ruber]TDG28506.1 adenylyl-sulfate kinase [Paracraurococcus ruber]
MGPPCAGEVFWTTGLSGAGKSTVAALLRDRLVAAGRCCVLLDGDVLRGILDAGGDYAPHARRRLAFSYARLCHELAAQGLTVVCATISMVHDVRRWNRANIPNYREIWLRVPVEELARRDAKGLYAAAASGALADLAGLHQAVEEPDSPDLIIDNHGAVTAALAVDRIWTRFGLGEACR